MDTPFVTVVVTVLTHDTHHDTVASVLYTIEWV